MPKYCPECGVKLPKKDAKFCMECGAKIELNKDKNQDTQPQKINKAYIFNLGEKMEEAVEQIFIAKGYDTKRRQRIKGNAGTINEIDILAQKKRIKIAIECKNYSTPIGQSQLRDFVQKLKEIRINNGYFVSNSDFTSGANKFAQQMNITLWSKENVMEEYWHVNIGRSKIGQEYQVKNALPLKVNYNDASKLELKNLKVIHIESSSLFYKPFFVVEYRFKARYKDPTRTTHEFYDEGTVAIDGLDGTIVNKYNMMGKLKKILANSDDEIDLTIKDELKHYDKVENYRVVGDPFSVHMMESNVQTRFVKKLAIDFITDINKKDIYYTPKSAETSFDQKVVNYSPKRKDILIKKINFLYVPKWKIQFQSLDHDYSREVYGYTGTKIEDTIEYCPLHARFGGLRIISRKTNTLCEICGKALCDEHISQCPECGKWICEECGITCTNCLKIFCPEHINQTCSIDQKPLCDGCSITCPICHETYSSKYEIECAECGTKVCKNCTQTQGLLRRKRICINCI